MTPETEIRRAGEARHVLDNEVFQAAKAEIYRKLRDTRQRIATHSPPEQIADLVRVEQIADQFFDYFELVLQTGKLAEKHIQDEAQKRTLMERGLAMFRTIGRNTI